MRNCYECHGHIFMDGMDFAAARDRHCGNPVESAIRENLQQLSDAGVVYFRDGGDNLGVSLYARTLAAEYGIRYATPAFAIHRRGRYGRIVGKGYDTMSEFRSLAEEVKSSGGDFIKIMFSGIMRFEEARPFSCQPLETEEIKALVSEAHGMGLRVMAHVNGADAVLSAAEAGTDSIEHGYYANDACLEAMAESGCIWVPTLAAVEAFCGREGVDASVVNNILHTQLRQVKKASSMGIPVASGSDAGAVGVPHGGGILRELELLAAAGVSPEKIHSANEQIEHCFCRGG